MIRRSLGIHLDLPLTIPIRKPESVPQDKPTPKPRTQYPPELSQQSRAKIRRDTYRAQGLCIYGDKNPVESGHSACLSCLAKFRKGGAHGCDKPGRDNRVPEDRRRVEYRDKIRGGPPTRRHRGPRLKSGTTTIRPAPKSTT